MLIAGHFWLLFPLDRSVRLVYLVNICLTDMKWSGIGKIYYYDKCLIFTLIIPADILAGKVSVADCWSFLAPVSP